MRFFVAPFRAALLSTALVGLAAFAAPAAHAQTQIYTSLTAFLDAVQPNYYAETFNTGSTASASSFSFSNNGYGYTIAAVTGLTYESGDLIGTNSPNRALTITFTTGNVTALGGNFFNTDINNAFVSSPVTLTLSDGTARTFTPANMNIFRGVTTDIPIASLTFSAPGANRYASVDNFVVGARISPTAAPEPGTVTLVAVGALPLAGAIVRRRKRA